MTLPTRTSKAANSEDVPPLRLPGPHRQHRLGALDRLDFGLLVDARHQGPTRRGEVEADDVAHLVDERRVGRELERLHPVRLEAEGAPDPLHGRGGQPAGGGHRARAPVRGVRGRGLERAHQQVGDPLVGDRARGAAARLVPQTLEPVLGEALAPLADGVGADPDLAGHGPVGQTLRAAQDDPGPRRQVLRGLAPADQPLQLRPLLWRQRHRRRLALRHGLSPRQPCRIVQRSSEADY
jgi:hypothetical protein